MRFLIYTNVTSPAANEAASRLSAYLRAEGQTVDVYVEGEKPASPDAVLIIGGDGTVLRAVRSLHEFDAPFICVNCGHLGYLSECEPEEAERVLSRVLHGEYRLENRSLLRGYLTDSGKVFPFFALNEVVVHRAAYSRTLRTAVEIEDKQLMEVSGDGILIATPTGSTAYNLAAGGPILLPESHHLVITPICAHASLCSPVVVSADQTIRITVRLSGSTNDVAELPRLSVDSMHNYPLHDGATITVKPTTETARFIRLDETSFYERLRAKLSSSIR